MTFSCSNTIDDLILQAQPETAEQEALLRCFREHARANAELLQQLVAVVDSRHSTNNSAASFHEAWERIRWDSRTGMPNTLAPAYARAAIFCYPRLNGVIQFAPSSWDAVFGTQLAKRKLLGDYARRLEWCDGRPFTEAPTLKKTVQSILPAQGSLFEVAG
jgi:hypothetical protein